MEVKEYRCKNCDGLLNVEEARNGVIECPYCHSVFTLPKQSAGESIRELLQIAEHELDTGSFERAYTAYKKSAEADRNEPESYYGMALSEHKVQYLKDTVNNRLQPICHEISGKRFTDNANYKEALSLATAEQRAVYEAKAEEIENIRKEFKKLKDGGLNYDCFLCTKVTDASGGNTRDSYETLKMYNYLKEKGYSPFYSEEEIGKRTGAEYEALILYALHTSECMIVVCSEEEYLQTKWVKNEYTRFLKLINDEEKESDAITIAFTGMPIERLPGKKGKIQGIALNSPMAYAKIGDYVERHTPESRRRREEERARKEREAEEIRRQTEEIKRQMEEQDRARKELEEKLKNIQSKPETSTGASATVNSLLIRADLFLADGDMGSATEYYNKVLDADPQRGEAWWGLMLTEFNARGETGILSAMSPQLLKKVEASKNWQKADMYAMGKFKDRTEGFKKELYSPARWWKLLMSELGMSGEDDILNRVTEQLIERLHASENYANLKKYADREYRARIEKLEKGLASPNTYWKLFLQSYNVKDEKQLFGNITPEKADGVLKNKYYHWTKAGASGNLRETIVFFESILKNVMIKQSEILSNQIVYLETKKAETDKNKSDLYRQLKSLGKEEKRRKKDKKGPIDDEKFFSVIGGSSFILAIIVAVATLMSQCSKFNSLIGGVLLSAFIGVVGGGIVFGLACLLIFLPSHASYKKNKKKLNEIAAVKSKIADNDSAIRNCDLEIEKIKRGIETYGRLIDTIG